MPEETGRVAAVQAEVQYQPAEIAGQCVRVSANPAVLPWYTSPPPDEPLPDGASRLLVLVHGAVYGNSAGGQYVNRYAAVGREPDHLAERGIAVRFVISNPSTYLYFTDEHRWRYGFRDAPAYLGGDARASRRRYLGRDVTMVLGREDSDNASLLLETGPEAMSQGANRYERGLNYHAYIGGRHRLIELDGVGHAAADVMAAAPVRELLFGE